MSDIEQRQLGRTGLSVTVLGFRRHGSGRSPGGKTKFPTMRPAGC